MRRQVTRKDLPEASGVFFGMLLGLAIWALIWCAYKLVALWPF